MKTVFAILSAVLVSGFLLVAGWNAGWVAAEAQYHPRLQALQMELGEMSHTVDCLSRALRTVGRP